MENHSGMNDGGARMTPEQIGALARSKYGKTMCVACGKAEADRIAKAAEAAEQDGQAEQTGEAHKEDSLL